MDNLKVKIDLVIVIVLVTTSKGFDPLVQCIKWNTFSVKQVHYGHTEFLVKVTHYHQLEALREFLKSTNRPMSHHDLVEVIAQVPLADLSNDT